MEVTDLHPFTHVAYIPADTDLSSIKVEGVKAAKVATRQRSVTSTGPAYRVSCSYKGQPMASDEYGSTSFTFSVYFRAGELNPGLLRALSSGSISRATAAEFFQFATSRGSRASDCN